MSQRMTAAEYQKLITSQAADSQNGRYGANKRLKTVEGKFDSKGELARWKVLCLMEKQGFIKNLRRQVPFELAHDSGFGRVVICTYVADHVYQTTDDGTQIVEDFKGKIITPEFNLKRKMMKAFYNIDVLIVTSPKEDTWTAPVGR